MPTELDVVIRRLRQLDIERMALDERNRRRPPSSVLPLSNEDTPT